MRGSSDWRAHEVFIIPQIPAVPGSKSSCLAALSRAQGSYWNANVHRPTCRLC
jgi:hypothetical protein